MKKQLFSFLILLSFVFSISAQRLKTEKPSVTDRNLRRHVSYLTSDKLEGRRTGEKGAVYAAGYVANQFASLKLKAGFRSSNGKVNFLQSFPYRPRNAKGEILPDAKEVRAYNVIGILPGTDPVLKREAIVIGAHYDHLGKGGMGSLAANSNEIHHGADDNSSGTAAMIELARQFVKAKNNKRTLIFIGFAGEEEGLLGSRHYINNPVVPLDRTIAMVNMDMVGRMKDDKLTIGGVGTAAEWKELITKKNEMTPPVKATTPKVPTGPNPTPESIFRFNLQLNEDGFGPSDHSSFYGKQIPVLFFFTGTHLDYHKPTDTAEKINYQGLADITDFVRQIVEYVDRSMSKRPTYTLARSSAPADTGRRSFNVTLGTIPGYADGDDGMLVDGVRDDTPAARTGLKAGDKIIGLAGKNVRNVQDYTAVLGELKADIEYEIIIMRGGQRLTLKIIPAARK